MQSCAWTMIFSLITLDVTFFIAAEVALELSTRNGNPADMVIQMQLKSDCEAQGVYDHIVFDLYAHLQVNWHIICCHHPLACSILYGSCIVVARCLSCNCYCEDVVLCACLVWYLLCG